MKHKQLILAILAIFSIQLYAQDVRSTDSLLLKLREMPDSLRLPYLDELSVRNSQRSDRSFYSNLLREEALRQHNDYYLSNAYFMLAQQNYGQNTDSMRYWIALAEPLLLGMKRYEPFFRMKAWDIYIMNSEGKSDEVIQAVDHLKALSKKVGYPEGEEMANQALADFYFSNKMWDEGEALYLNIYKQMGERNAPPVKQFNIIRQLFNRLPTSERRLKYLQQAEAFLNKCKAEGITELDKESPIYDYEYLIQRNYAHEYMNAKNFDEAWAHLKQAEKIAEEYDLVRSRMELPQVYANYYTLKGEYDKVLPYLSVYEENVRRRNLQLSLYDVLNQKSNVLQQLKRYDEAYAAAREMITLRDSINRQEFNNILAEIRTKHEVETLKYESEQMELKAQQSQTRYFIVLVGCFILLCIILGLSYMIRIIQRNRKELQIAKEKAEESDQMKSAFLANMNHEIRTPLNSIVGFSQVLIEEEDKESRREFANIIQHNNELLQRLIADVLDISKIESNSMSLFYHTLELPPLMKEICNSTKLRIPSGVELILDPCEPFTFEMDRNRLTQVITNLLNNAIKHTHTGHIRFGYESTDTDIRFYVEDTGEGIPKDRLETIFDRFVQLENGKRGVGLGLAICKGLVDKMNGQIWATSEMGKGSIFYVSIPKA